MRRIAPSQIHPCPRINSIQAGPFYHDPTLPRSVHGKFNRIRKPSPLLVQPAANPNSGNTNRNHIYASDSHTPDPGPTRTRAQSPTQAKPTSPIGTTGIHGESHLDFLRIVRGIPVTYLDNS